jgi:hypothetical protein
VSVYEVGFTAGGLLIAGGVLLLRTSVSRFRAEVVAEHGPARVRGGLYRSRQVRRG